MTGNRKFFVAMASFILSALYIVACIFYQHLTSIAVPFFTCLGTIDGAFFTANIGEHWMGSKKDAVIP